MKKICFTASICIACIFAISYTTPSAGTLVHPKPQDSLAVEREKFIKIIVDSLGDKKNFAADSVFKNLRVFTSSERVPVRHFLAIMDYWGEALNVSCTYCHTTVDWSSDTMRTKRVAREMYWMRQTINRQILAQMYDIDHKRAEVNCSTCHNGKAIPKG